MYHTHTRTRTQTHIHNVAQKHSEVWQQCNAFIISVTLLVCFLWHLDVWRGKTKQQTILHTLLQAFAKCSKERASDLMWRLNKPF